jgi:hypothetical protein
VAHAHGDEEGKVRPKRADFGFSGLAVRVWARGKGSVPAPAGATGLALAEALGRGAARDHSDLGLASDGVRVAALVIGPHRLAWDNRAGALLDLQGRQGSGTPSKVTDDRAVRPTRTLPARLNYPVRGGKQRSPDREITNAGVIKCPHASPLLPSATFRCGR